MPNYKCLLCGGTKNLQKTPNSSSTKPEYLCKTCSQMNDVFADLEDLDSPSISDIMFKKDN